MKASEDRQEFYEAAHQPKGRAMTKETQGKGRYGVVIGTARGEVTHFSDDKNTLSKIRSAAYLDGLGVSVIFDTRSAS